jgi:hypothetical protein
MVVNSFGWPELTPPEFDRRRNSNANERTMEAVRLGVEEYKERLRSIYQNESPRNVRFRSYAGFQNAGVQCQAKTVKKNPRVGSLRRLFFLLFKITKKITHRETIRKVLQVQDQ